MPRPIITRPNKDHWGYYTVGNYKTYSKLEAIEYSATSNTPVVWHYNSDVFKNVDWSTEPPGSLDFYYHQRALQLREKYDYLVLLYSGGSDSHNMLMTFVENNIFIDEIVQFHQHDAYNGDKQAVANLEQFATSIPITQQIIENNPVYKHTVHRLIDISGWKKQTLKTAKNKWNWWHTHNDFFNLESDSMSNLKNHEPAYREISDTGKTVCFVWGFERPFMSQCPEGNFVFSFYDTTGNSYVSVERKIANEAWDIDEAFYWTPDLPELVVKQAHVFKRYVEQMSPDQIDHFHVTNTIVERDRFGLFPDNNNTPVFSFYKDKQPYTILLNGMRRLIYNHWNPELIVKPKMKSLVFTDTDRAFLQSNAPDVGQHHYIKGFVALRQYMKKNATQYWFEYDYDPNVNAFNGGLMSLHNSYSLTRKK